MRELKKVVGWINLTEVIFVFFFFFSSRRRHTRFDCDWSSDVCSSDLQIVQKERVLFARAAAGARDVAAVAHGAPGSAGQPADAELPEGEPLHRVHGEIGRASCRERV